MLREALLSPARTLTLVVGFSPRASWLGSADSGRQDMEATCAPFIVKNVDRNAYHVENSIACFVSLFCIHVYLCQL